MNNRCLAVIGCLVWNCVQPLSAEELPIGTEVPATGIVLALQSTLRSHPSLRGKLAEREAKLASADGARALRYPSLSTQWSVQNQSQPGSLRARQPIWAFGRIESSIAHADADAQVETADLLRVQRQLIDQAAAAYVRAHGARLRAVVAAENLEQLRLLHARIQRREQGLLASAADVSLSRSRLTQAQAQLDRLQTELQLAETELEALAQTRVDSGEPVPEMISALGGALALDELLARAALDHADLRLKEQRVQLALAEVEKERLSAMPGVYLQADRSFNSTTALNNSTTYGVVLEAGLDNLGQVTSGKVRGAQARHEAALADRDTTLTEVQRSLKSLHLQRETQRQLIASQRQSVGELLSLLGSYQRQYEAGYKSWLEVLNMQRELTDQRLQQVQAETDWLQYSLRIAAQLGLLDSLGKL